MPITCLSSLSLDDPMKRFSDVPGELTHAHIFARFFEVFVRAPTDVFDDFRILSILMKDRLGIGKFCFSQS